MFWAWREPTTTGPARSSSVDALAKKWPVTWSAFLVIFAPHSQMRSWAKGPRRRNACRTTSLLAVDSEIAWFCRYTRM